LFPYSARPSFSVKLLFFCLPAFCSHQSVANITVSSSKTLGNNYGCSTLYTSTILNSEIQFLAGELQFSLL
jgi:ribosomal protein L7Ae-like RNA K-turn-binding protein